MKSGAFSGQADLTRAFQRHAKHSKAEHKHLPLWCFAIAIAEEVKKKSCCPCSFYQAYNNYRLLVARDTTCNNPCCFRVSPFTCFETCHSIPFPLPVLEAPNIPCSAWIVRRHVDRQSKGFVPMSVSKERLSRFFWIFLCWHRGNQKVRTYDCMEKE